MVIVSDPTVSVRFLEEVSVFVSDSIAFRILCKILGDL